MTGTLSGRGVFLWFFVFFAVIFAVNVLFIVQAVGTFSGEDEEDSYMQGVTYNQTLERHAMQKVLGWTATIGAERETRGAADIVVTLASRTGAPLDRLKIDGTLRRPTNAAWDHALHFVSAGPGRYVAHLDGIAAGIWDVEVTTPGNPPFDASRRLWIP
jgi:nitrogen fixation protein FixH